MDWLKNGPITIKNEAKSSLIIADIQLTIPYAGTVDLGKYFTQEKINASIHLKQAYERGDISIEYVGTNPTEEDNANMFIREGTHDLSTGDFSYTTNFDINKQINLIALNISNANTRDIKIIITSSGIDYVFQNFVGVTTQNVISSDIFRITKDEEIKISVSAGGGDTGILIYKIVCEEI